MNTKNLRDIVSRYRFILGIIVILIVLASVSFAVYILVRYIIKKKKEKEDAKNRKKESKLLKQWYNSLKPYQFNTKENFDMSLIPTDDVFDIRDQLPPVKQQGSCGSSAIFSIVGVMSDMYSRQRGKIISLSEQYIINCLYDCAPYDLIGRPCDGKTDMLSLSAFLKGIPLSSGIKCPDGTVLQSCIPNNICISGANIQQLYSQKCPTQCITSSDPNPEHFYIKDCKSIKFEPETSLEDRVQYMKNYLRNIGSIGVVVELLIRDQDRMMKTTPFIPKPINKETDYYGIHAMVIVGWKKDMWIIRNSRGSCDPQYGYVYWKMGAGIESEPTLLYVIEI